MAELSWWVPLGAALLGGILTMLGAIVTEGVKRAHERRSLAMAFRGELLAVIEIVKLRRYEEVLDSIADMLERQQPVTVSPIRIERNYFPIYTGNASRIGILPPDIAERVSRTYTFANSFIEDATMPESKTITPAAVGDVEQTLTVLRRVLQEARETTDLIERAYLPSPIRRPRRRFMR